MDGFSKKNQFFFRFLLGIFIVFFLTFFDILRLFGLNFVVVKLWNNVVLSRYYLSMIPRSFSRSNIPIGAFCTLSMRERRLELLTTIRIKQFRHGLGKLNY
jgi:hypothetical protein